MASVAVESKACLTLARCLAQYSDCTSRQYGAVIVKRGKIIGFGYNDIPFESLECTRECYRKKLGFKHNEGDYKCCPSIHAEVNAIHMVKNKRLLKGSTIYLVGLEKGLLVDNATPCMNCLKELKKYKVKYLHTFEGIKKIFW